MTRNVAPKGTQHAAVYRPAFSLTSPAMLFFTIGAAASAAKSTPITTFLMIFYNQVVGLPALSVSAILMATLVFDAFFDPLIGHVSDNWRSRLGRRLPLMYMSAVPLTVFFILLWIPPVGWSSVALHYYLAICLVGVRFCDTLFELPHLALIPELSSDYHQRTQIFTIRSMADSATGLGISMLAYNVFMKQAADGSGGILSLGGYSTFALFCGAVILISIWTCTAGLQHWGAGIASAKKELCGPVISRWALLEIARNPQLAVLVGATLLISIASGTGSALGLYWMIYYFGFSQVEITWLSVPAMLGFVSVSAAPYITRRLGKRNAAVALCWSYGIISSIPMIALMLGWVGIDSPALFAMAAVQCFLAPALITMALIALASMIADLVEDVEVRTSRRAEGLLLSSVGFIRKLMTGAGTLAAGLILTAVSFPKNAQRNDVAEAVLVEMVWSYLAIKTLLFIAATLILLRYRYTQEIHEANLITLSERR